MADLTVLAEWERDLLYGEPDVKLLDGELVVFTRHPQRGVQLHGAIRAVGIVPAELQPSVRWQITARGRPTSASTSATSWTRSPGCWSRPRK